MTENFEFVGDIELQLDASITAFDTGGSQCFLMPLPQATRFLSPPDGCALRYHA